MAKTKKEVVDDYGFGENDIPKSNWFKFEEVGDSIAGELIEVTEKKSNNAMFKDQRVFVIKQKDGSIMNVGIAIDKDYIIQRTNNIDLMKFDYLIKFEFKKEIPAKTKGYQPAKSIEVYIKKSDKKEISADDINLG